MINKVILIGRAGKDAEVFTFENGNEKASISLATSRSYKDKNDQWQEVTQWHNVSRFKPSEAIKAIQKGNRVYVEGEVTYREYEKDGEKRYATEIIAHVVRNLTPSGEENPF